MTTIREEGRDAALSDNVAPINPSIDPSINIEPTMNKPETVPLVPELSQPTVSKKRKGRDANDADATESDEIRLSDFILDVKRMAVFATEKGKLPKDISLGEIYNIWHAKQKGYIEPSMINTISDYYLKLEVALGAVTAFSLKATRCHNIDDCMDSDAGRYVLKLIYLVFAVVFIIVATYIYGYYYESYIFPGISADVVEITGGVRSLVLLHQFGQYLVPFTFGTLGALAYILRFSVGRLHKREFDPRRIPGNYIRIVLGTISGGAIVMFINSQTTQVSIGVDLTAAALGFLAGYSTDFLFNIVDKLKGSLGTGNIDNTDNKRTKASHNTEQKIVVELKEQNKENQFWRKRNRKKY